MIARRWLRVHIKKSDGILCQMSILVASENEMKCAKRTQKSLRQEDALR